MISWFTATKISLLVNCRVSK